MLGRGDRGFLRSGNESHLQFLIQRSRIGIATLGRFYSRLTMITGDSLATVRIYTCLRSLCSWKKRFCRRLGTTVFLTSESKQRVVQIMKKQVSLIYSWSFIIIFFLEQITRICSQIQFQCTLSTRSQSSTQDRRDLQGLAVETWLESPKNDTMIIFEKPKRVFVEPGRIDVG